MQVKIMSMVFLSIFSGVCYASENYAAAQFAREYARELQEAKAQEAQTPHWLFDATVRAGTAIYKEKGGSVKSYFKTIYPELLLTGAYRMENGIEPAFEFGFGRSLTDKETWKVSNMQYQTNDLYFYRINARGAIGKRFAFGSNESFAITPFFGYGFRLINFQRSNFNILNMITIRDVVTEKYYIHHADVGLKLEQKINDKFNIFAAGIYDYVFYNEADNNELGKIKGDGRYIGEFNFGLAYALNEYWRLSLGGFGELQDLKGGQKGSVLWPDNKLLIYGGQIGANYSF